MRSQTDVPGRLESLRSAWVRLSDGSDLRATIERAWKHDDNWVVKFAGVDSIGEADRLRGADIWVPLSERASLPEGDFFRTDLLDCSVYAAATGERIGAVKGFQQFGGPLLLEVSIDGQDVLVPFVDSICSKVDLETKSIWVDPPEGLLEL